MSHGDKSIYQNLLLLCRRTRWSWQFQIHGKIYKMLILRSKVKVIQRSWMLATHCKMVIHWCAKHCIIMSKDKKGVARTQSHIINPLIWSEVEGQWCIVIMNATHRRRAIHPWAKYGQTPKKSDTNLHRQMADRRTDKVIPKYPPPPISFTGVL